MQLFKILDGAYLGFYQGRGGTVFISGYRIETRREWVCEMVTEEYTTPDEWVRKRYWIEGHYTTRQFNVPEKEETYIREVPGHYETERQYIQGHYETREIWIPEHEAERLVEIPGYYESRTVQEPGQWIETRVLKAGYWEDYLVTRPADPATGRLEVSYWDKRWVPERWYTRKVWEEGRTRLVKFWVDTTWEMQTVTVPGGYRDHRVWVEGEYKDVELWVPTTMEQVTVLIPEHTETREVWIPIRELYREVNLGGKVVTGEHLVCHWKDVQIEVPIYSYYSEYDEYDLVGRERGPVFVIAGPPEGDKLQLRLIESGDIIDVEAEYLGLTVRNDDNAYTVPPFKTTETTREQELSEAEIEKIKWGD